MNERLFRFLLFGFVVSAFVASCSNPDTSNQEPSEEISLSSEVSDEPYVNYDSIWLEEFVAFRDAVYRQNLKAIKGFVDFPMEPGAIWYLSFTDELDWSEIDASKSFPEQNFDKKYKRIFDKDFIDHILKVKSKVLFAEGNFVTQEVRIGEEGIKMYANYSSDEKSLSLMLHYTRYHQYDDEDETTTESSRIYNFKLLNNKLRFVGVDMAG
jgi:hypothetical protein